MTSRGGYVSGRVAFVTMDHGSIVLVLGQSGVPTLRLVVLVVIGIRDLFATR